MLKCIAILYYININGGFHMKRKGIVTHLLVAAMLVSTVSGIGGSASAAKAKVPKISATKKTIEAKKSFTLKIKNNGTKITKTTWKTSKKKVAAISKASKTSVKVTGKSKGTAKITATVKFKAGSKKLTKKLVCNVSVKKPAVQATASPVTTTQNPGTGATPTVAPTTAPTSAPTATPTATPVPEYYKYNYFVMYDASKATNPYENMYVNFVLSDSWQTNTKPSAIKSLEFSVDSTEAGTVELFVSEYDCDIATEGAKKICDIQLDGTTNQKIEITDDIAGNPDIAELDYVNGKDNAGNGRISFGFSPNGKNKFVIHDMYVNYVDNNLNTDDKIAHHEAALSVVTCGIGSATTQYYADKKAAEDAKQKFDATLEQYQAQKPAGLIEARPKDASEAIAKYDSLAKITEAKGYKFGTCVTYNLIKNDPEFCKLLAHHCDSITAMNEFKAYSLLDEDATLAAYKDDETSMPVMKYEKADFLCEWARDNGLKIRGHALVWDNSMEENHKWFFTKGYKQEGGEYASNEICRKRLQYYVDEVMRHFQTKYPDVVYCWDVVNEGIDENSGDKLKIRQNRMGQNPFYYHCSSEANGKGEDYVKFTFDCAYDTREAMINEGLLSDRGKIELVYNDYNVIESNKRPYVKALVEYLNSDPNRQICDAVGCQGYLGAYQKQQGCLTTDWVDKTTTTIKEFSQMDPPVHVQLTEMAMRNFDWAYLDDHGTFAANLFEGLANINAETNNSFTSMSIWAFIDDPVMNKVEESFDYWQYAPFSGMFDECYRVKPAFINAYDILSK